VAPALASRLDLRGDVLVAELNAEALVRLAARGRVRYEPVSPYPTVERDLAVVVDEGTPVGPLLATIREAGRPLVKSVRVFDLYRGDRIPAGTKSVAFSVRMGSDHTLTDAEIAGRMRRVVAALESEHGARLRD
jgi:phenylalanyl-tRNA synthetase beta chain